MNQFDTLMGDEFAPVTSRMGFLRASLDDVAEALTEWRRDIHGSAQARRIGDGLRANVSSLEPLTSRVRPRELLVATGNPDWTAVFDCGAQGGDPRATIGFLARTMRVLGVAVVSIPDTRAAPGRPERYGARQFEMFGPIATEFLNHVRSISLVRDGSRWRFDAVGTVQDFEQVDAYRRTRIQERFSAAMLVEYSEALGLEPFNEAFFPGPCVLVTNPVVPSPEAAVMSIKDAQLRWGIVPGG